MGWGFCLFVFCLAFVGVFVRFFFDDTCFCEVIFLWEEKKKNTFAACLGFLEPISAEIS